MSFPSAASVTLRDSQLRRNLAKATGTIRDKRAGVVDELDPTHCPQEPQRPVADVKLAQRVAGRVVGDAVGVVRAHVLDAEHVYEELRELIDRHGIVQVLAQHPGA